MAATTALTGRTNKTSYLKDIERTDKVLEKAQSGGLMELQVNKKQAA